MIDVRNIYKTFILPHEVKALVDVSTKIEPGEVVVVCGPSGSGKSTYLRCLNRLEIADSGQIIIDGIDVLDPKTNINQRFDFMRLRKCFINITDINHAIAIFFSRRWTYMESVKVKTK